MLNERKEDFDDGEERVAAALETLTTEELRRLLAEIQERLRRANGGARSPRENLVVFRCRCELQAELGHRKNPPG
jgi:redox-regulated HSP33 family molecular chaperone